MLITLDSKRNAEMTVSSPKHARSQQTDSCFVVLTASNRIYGSAVHMYVTTITVFHYLPSAVMQPYISFAKAIVKMRDESQCQAIVPAVCL